MTDELIEQLGNIGNVEWEKQGGSTLKLWKNPGDNVKGVWVGQKPGKFCPMGTLETAEGTVDVPLNTGLLNQLGKVKPGTMCSFTYTGDRPSKGGKIFKHFDVLFGKVTA